MDDKLITIYTFQNPKVLKKLQRQGFTSGDGRYIWHIFRPAYKWLKSKMMEKVPGYRGNNLIWFWIDRPDLRQMGFKNHEEMVLLTLQVPASKCLLLSFDAWHCVLNQDYCPLNDLEETGEIIKSWDRVFDLELLNKSSLWKPTKIQGVIEEISLNQITQVRKVKPRR